MRRHLRWRSADQENGAGLSTTASDVTLFGQTSPDVTVLLVQTGATALSSNTGAYQFPDVPVSLGANGFTVTATNAGGSSQFQATIERDASSGHTNQVVLWDRDHASGHRAGRIGGGSCREHLAIMSASVFDAVNSVDGSAGYYVKLAAPADASPDAAVAAAAYTAPSYLYPAQQAFLNMSFANALASIPTGQAKTDGEAVGQIGRQRDHRDAAKRRVDRLHRLHSGIGGRATGSRRRRRLHPLKTRNGPRLSRLR